MSILQANDTTPGSRSLAMPWSRNLLLLIIILLVIGDGVLVTRLWLDGKQRGADELTGQLSREIHGAVLSALDGYLQADAPARVASGQELGEFLSTLAPGPGIQVAVSQRDGTLLATSVEGIRAAILARLVDDALAADPWGSGLPRQWEARVHAKRRLVRISAFGKAHGLDWLVLTALPTAPASAVLDDNLDHIFWLFALALLGAVGLGIALARRFAAPVAELERTAHALHESEARLRLITDNVPGCISFLDRSQHYRFVNRTYEDWFGCRRTDLLGRSVREVIGEAAYQRVAGFIERVLQGGSVSYEAALPYRDGGTRHVVAHLVPGFDERGEVDGYYALITDISERKRVELALNRTSRELQAFMDHAPALISLVDREGRYLRVNPAFAHLLGKPEAEIMGRRFAKFWPESVVTVFDSRLRALEANGAPLVVEDELALGDDTRIFRSILFPVPGDDNLPAAFWAIASDITEQIRAERELQRLNARLKKLAVTDDLTQLANRRQLQETLAREWQRLQRESRILTLVLLDVDHFKAYNDHYGHPQGDSCLRQVADTLQSCINRPGDLVGRYGGEEFLIILPDTDEAGARTLVERIRRALHELAIPHRASATSEILTVSMGVAITRVRVGMESRELLNRVDAALYRAKQRRDSYWVENCS